MDRATIRHPITGILRRAARMAVTPDEHELAELSVDDATRERVRVAARTLTDDASQGGMRARNLAAAQADRHATAIIELVPPEYADAVTREPDDVADVRTAAELAAAINRRRHHGASHGESIDERIARLGA